tara:strand:+ start:3718 stop:4872 length:1155 start_codon:yes stop_codon:yes gene_type:complete
MMKLLGLSVSLVIAAIVTLSSAVPTVNLGNPLHLRDGEPAPNPVSATCGRYGPCDLEKSQVCLNASTGLVCLRGCWEALLKCDGRSQCTNYNDGYMCCRRLDIEMPRTLCYKDGQLVEHPPAITLGEADDVATEGSILHTRDGDPKQLVPAAADHNYSGACDKEGDQCCQTENTGWVCRKGQWTTVLACGGGLKCMKDDDDIMCCKVPRHEGPAGICYRHGKPVLSPPTIGEEARDANEGISERATKDGAPQQISNGSACKPDGSRRCGLYYGTPSVFLCNVDKWEIREACTTDGWQDECKDEPEPHCTKSDDPCAGCGEHFEDCLLVSTNFFAGAEVKPTDDTTQNSDCSRGNEACHSKCNVDTCNFDNGRGLCGVECGWPCH